MGTHDWGWSVLAWGTLLLACGETTQNEASSERTPTSTGGAGGTASTTRMSDVDTTTVGTVGSTSVSSSGVGGTSSSSGVGGGTTGGGSSSGGTGTGGTDSGATTSSFPPPLECTCGELTGDCSYRVEDFCFGFDCAKPGLDDVFASAPAFCNGDASQFYSYCDDGTHRFFRSWGAGENDATLVFSDATGALTYGMATGYLDTPCGSEGIIAEAGTRPADWSCYSCTICDYGKDFSPGVAGAAGAGGAGSAGGNCVWVDGRIVPFL